MDSCSAEGMNLKRKSQSDSKELLEDDELKIFLFDSPTILPSSSPVKKKKYHDGVPESLDFLSKTSAESSSLDMSLDDKEGGCSLLQVDSNPEEDVLNVSSKTTLELLDMSLEEPVGQLLIHDTSNTSDKTTLELLDMSLEEPVCSSLQIHENHRDNSFEKFEENNNSNFETVVKKCINNMENIFETKSEVNVNNNTGVSSATPSESSGNPGTMNNNLTTKNWCLIM